ncbi:patatin-like phospholipase family protein [Corticibacterium sp. UT-5YL-CI-8]|nr:patatin-like phospholipase family protein [Tianweitania sp. UT-5YL-CI-8]
MEIPENRILVLSGGNALGAYHAGAFEALASRGLQPSRIVGTSIGAITGAIIAGNAPEKRVAQLREFWRRAEQPGFPRPSNFLWPGPRWEKWLTGLQTLLAGRPALFLPEVSGLWLTAFGGNNSSLLDSSPTGDTLRDLIDFDRLNAGEIRLVILAVDAESGEDVVFDTSQQSITAEHLRASTSLPVLFSPVEIEGRWLLDGGLSANLPIGLALQHPPSVETLCIAIDLLPGKGMRPDSLGQAALRAQDLIFSCQSRHAIQALKASWLGAPRQENTFKAATTLLHMIYGTEAQETALKSLDFGGEAISRRWAAGKADTIASLAQLAGARSPSTKWLSTIESQNGVLRRVN